MKDDAIIDLYFQRDESAIVESDAKYGAYCRAISGNILPSREDTEECVNDTWLRAWNAMPPTRPNVLKLFFAKIIRNISFDRYKRANAQKRGGGEIDLALSELEECIAARSDVEDEVEARELENSINRFLATLSETERNIFLRRYFYVEKVSSIAQRYSMRDSNVFVILSRTRAKLKKHLTDEGYFI